MTAVEFRTPADPTRADDLHHARAAAANTRVVDAALATLTDALGGTAEVERILLRASAGAGKSFALVRMVEHALAVGGAGRVAVTAFQNRQVQPLARKLGESLGAQRVALLAGKAVVVPDDVSASVTVVRKATELSPGVEVVLGTASRLGAIGERRRLVEKLGAEDDGHPFDVLFVDEAWQMPQHLFAKVKDLGRVIVGVGDVGQLPPLDPGQNPWRGDPGHNPYRAWPTAFADDSATWAEDLPTVWRPAAEQLGLWRAFYPDWAELHSVAAPGDRSLVTALDDVVVASVWGQVGSARPTLLEVTGLEEPDSPDVDLPLMSIVETLLDQILTGGFELRERVYGPDGSPGGDRSRTVAAPGDDPLLVILATRNQAVDDAQAIVERLVARHGLGEGVLVASTVDSWQGQTNGITIAVHPLSGADRLDEFNSAFGRLAVACTRATHGLILLAREGLDELLADAAARPGTAFGEPGPRTLPRQTHDRIVAALDRGVLDVADLPQPAHEEGSPA